MPNLGDRALQEGMGKLLAASHHGTLIYDEWNSFPYLTLARLKRGRQASRDKLAGWQRAFRRRAGTRAPIQRFFADFLLGRPGSWLPFWSWLDRQSLKRTGQTGREALGPRLFPGLAARTFADRLAACDAVIMNAGGLLADHLAYYLPTRIFALQAGQLAGKPTAIVNYSFAVTDPDLLAWVAPVIRAVDLHAVRESRSRERLLSLGVAPERIVVVPDAAFAADPPVVRRNVGNNPLTIALQIRGDRQVDIAAWAELIRELQARFAARITVLAGCCKHDPPVISRLQQLSPVTATTGGGGLMELREAIGQADLLISDRYHGAVFATQMGTPFIPLIGTTLKTPGLIADLGYAIDVYPPLTRRGIPAILSAVDTALARRDTLSAQLLAKSESLRARLFDDYTGIMQRLLGPVIDTTRGAV